MISNQIQVIVYNFHKGLHPCFLSGVLSFSYGAQCTVCSIQCNVSTACSFQQAPPQVGSALDLLKQPANQSQKYFSHMSFLLACCQCTELWSVWYIVYCAHSTLNVCTVFSLFVSQTCLAKCKRKLSLNDIFNTKFYRIKFKIQIFFVISLSLLLRH